MREKHANQPYRRRINMHRKQTREQHELLHALPLTSLAPGGFHVNATSSHPELLRSFREVWSSTSPCTWLGRICAASAPRTCHHDITGSSLPPFVIVMSLTIQPSLAFTPPCRSPFESSPNSHLVRRALSQAIVQYTKKLISLDTIGIFDAHLSQHLVDLARRLEPVHKCH